MEEEMVSLINEWTKSQLNKTRGVGEKIQNKKFLGWPLQAILSAEAANKKKVRRTEEERPTVVGPVD